MAITHAALQTASMQLAAQVEQGLIEILTDKAWLRNTGALVDFGVVNGGLSDTSTVRLWSGGGSDAMAAASTEISDETLTDPTYATATIAVARYSLVREQSDLGIATEGPGGLSPMKLAADVVNSYEAAVNAAIATAIATASTDVGGGAGVDLRVSDYFDAIYTLQAADNPAEGLYCLIDNQAFIDFQRDLQTAGGYATFDPATRELIAAKGQGFVGRYMGVDIYKSSQVTTGAGVTNGAMWSQGALGIKSAAYGPEHHVGSSNTVITQGDVLVELDRVLAGGRVKIAGEAMFGVGVIEQARLVGIVSDA